MNASISCDRRQIEGRRSLILENAAGLEVSGLSGEVWITQHGDSRDFVIRPGEHLLLDRPGSAVLSAVRHAEVLVIRRDATARTPHHSLWRRLAGLLDPRWSGAAQRSMVRGRFGQG
ncbi:DUF2917 domain-containing protein [Cognatazoarcus halotolerans]|uniref:DUF2917 domain-containing protein n=1 Tax=Cognatazoarcus halotolerans TaxID=2686016 RepID=UPI00135A5794|nr:DUF2917 domain-containing protein [Cognatazoarcus halotolerans]MCB1900031.1 DUF2917 domain-containing protein [Rhodocyclaceae bacterium]MCP5310278.1 DUF2917 domain-containing protein [Zoogloeaceae bacterium]MCP5353395.1 DUF2917 domain-containing protein [Chromatiales bacterium]